MINDLIQNVDPTPYIAASWIVSALALGGMVLWVWQQWATARKNK